MVALTKPVKTAQKFERVYYYRTSRAFPRAARRGLNTTDKEQGKDCRSKGGEQSEGKAAIKATVRRGLQQYDRCSQPDTLSCYRFRFK